MGIGIFEMCYLQKYPVEMMYLHDGCIFIQHLLNANRMYIVTKHFLVFLFWNTIIMPFINMNIMQFIVFVI